MRHYKTDVSHRMRRRPSLFTAPWFRVVFGGGIVVILALLLGPPVSGWLRSGQGAAVTRLAPRVAPVAPVMPLAAVNAAKAVETVSPPPAPAVTTAVTASPEPATPASRAPDSPPANSVVKAKPPADAASVPKSSVTTAARAVAAPAPAGPALYRIQVGAFLDHRNADRLIERLRGEGFEVASSLVEESRTAYRVLALPADGEGRDALVQRLRELGFSPELTGDGAAVTQPVPLRGAVETSRQLKAQGIRVRLEREASSAAFRVVRVGGYSTAEEAEKARGQLAAKGYEGVVVREH
jgi:cell division protein FtsN